MTRQLARACARYPKRTLLTWLVVVLASIACIAAALDLSSEGDLTGNPESKRAAEIVFQRGLYERRPVDEIVIVRSERYTVGADDHDLVDGAPLVEPALEDDLGGALRLRVAGEVTLGAQIERGGDARDRGQDDREQIGRA